jgi:hypothetical protein
LLSCSLSAADRSVDHPLRPVHKDVVRGETQNTFWRFKSVGRGKTEIEVESQLNPKLPISSWVINFMQTSYQKASLMQLLDIVKRAQPHPGEYILVMIVWSHCCYRQTGRVTGLAPN